METYQNNQKGWEGVVSNREMVLSSLLIFIVLNTNWEHSVQYIHKPLIVIPRNATINNP